MNNITAGLDFRADMRAACLKPLPDQRFLVKSCETADKFAVCIAMPDAQVLVKPTSEIDQDDIDIAWDCRGELGVITSKIKRDKILEQIQINQVHIQAIDIESEAIARALRILCDVVHEIFGILYGNHEKFYLSVFKNQQKIFFHQENIPDNIETEMLEIVVSRSFKLFETKYPDCKLTASQCYLIGEQVEVLKSNWGIVPDITQKLNFESQDFQEKFKKENTQWLLACGLALWDKKSSWNLMPWRESEKQAERKNLIRQAIKVILCGLCAVLIAHSLFILALYFQHQDQIIVDKKIEALQAQVAVFNQTGQEIRLLQSQINEHKKEKKSEKKDEDKEGEKYEK